MIFRMSLYGEDPRRLMIGGFFVGLLALVAVLSIYVPDLVMLVTGTLIGGVVLVAWPSLTLALYANAGLFKADERLAGLTGSVDLTLALAAVLLFALIYRFVWHRDRIVWRAELGLMLLFCGVLLMGLWHTPALGEGVDKVLRFTSLTFLAFLAPFIIVSKPGGLNLFLGAWVVLAMVFALEALSGLGSAERLSAFNSTSIGMSRMVGVAALVVLFWTLAQQSGWLRRVAGLVVVVLLVLVLLGSGSRGPLLALVLAVSLTLIMSVMRPGRYLRSLVALGVLATMLAIILSAGILPPSAVERFDSLLSQTESDTSAQARLLVMREAWQLFESQPAFGHGIGSVSAYGVGQEQIYPHNILLELAAETGLVGLGLFLVITCIVLVRLTGQLSGGLEKTPVQPVLLAVLLFTLLNAMVSGDINDNRDLWLFTGLAAASATGKGAEEK